MPSPPPTSTKTPAANPEALRALEAAKHLLRIKEAEDSYLGFIRLLHPEWTLAPFQLRLIEALDRLEKGTLTLSWLYGTEPRPDEPVIHNLLVTMPPRHGKTAFCTIHFPAYYMARDPRRFVMSCSYNAELASDFGREARDLTQEPVLKQAFPDFSLAQDSRAADVWRTDAGGSYFGIGLGGTTAGRPANLLIVDDPIKAREEAESMTMRNKAWSYYTSSLANRLQPEASGAPPKQLVILTRWHPDDPAGRLMATQDWKDGLWGHLNIPAISKDADGTETALWPARFPLAELKRRERLNPREFSSLYQQQPYVVGGNLIKLGWWRFHEGDPPAFQTIIIAADTAFKTKESNDYTVLLTAGLTHTGDIHIIDVERNRWEFPDLKARLIALNAQWRGRGLRAIYVEDKASGQSLIQELRRESGISLIPYKPGSYDKVARTNSVTPLIEGGRVWLPKSAPWLDAFILETQQFPGSPHDDQVDAMTIALDALSRQATYMPDVDLDPSNSLNNAPPNLKDRAFQSLRSKFKAPAWTGWGV